ncbi:hypothetical protein [Vibrio neptunius]|uniref:Uncharacterized protein n=1 Tax=Vibrio neptunius TaxID=170651 RepID=A0ABS3A6N4_9VIBR|nr:hypothetical protein [Vibrio neptunius]MBN3494746.1 hypothetical protein [Vibrio neptunius]MBN3517108.1 hypothetical protein [Vibrio neptunius]MBN3551212.1 hypothetical protein [Vibrio neptunius]MBN3579504.1 hypothetical protein [Vibrio neptunius]MCH9873169.1 hypothetical protein [Vibrio neptunius]
MMPNAILHARMNGTENKVELDVTLEDFEKMNDEDQRQIIGERLADLVDIFVTDGNEG